MTQEEKKLLLKDLCARLPYGVKVLNMAEGANEVCELDSIMTSRKHKDNIFVSLTLPDDLVMTGIEMVKPYLRPMSSMTEEEKKDLLITIVGSEGSKYFQVLQDGSIDNTDATVQDLNKFNMHWVNFDKDTVTLYLDWLNANHFDYRGLIEKGLAIEVTNENSPYKE